MLDLMTLISTLGVQQELSEAQREHKANLVIRDEETQEATPAEQATDLKRTSGRRRAWEGGRPHL